jgi:hypothetical protein
MVDFERIYGDRAGLFPAILALMSDPNKLLRVLLRGCVRRRSFMLV